ncbi:hypothetical protein ACQ4PT_044247 [Festuca glaucescens]
MEEAEGGVGRGGSGEDDAEERADVYCAVGKDAGREWRANLRWVLADFPRSQSHRRLVLVLAHVHRPPQRINMMGAWVPVSQVAEHEVAAYRKMEEDKASKALDDLIRICKTQGVHARKLVVAADDTTNGLIQLVDNHEVAELVMGAASDRAYTRKIRAPKSKKALALQRKANPNCRIWFVCKGNLICTREVTEKQSRASPSTASTSPRSSASGHSRSKSSPPQLPLHADGEPIFTMHDTAPSVRQTPSRHDIDNATNHSVEDIARQAAVETAEAEGASPTGLHPIQEGGEELSTPSSYSPARDAESTPKGEARCQRKAEERLRMEQDRRELDAIFNKIRKVDRRSAKLELHVAGSERAMGKLNVRRPVSRSLLDMLWLGRRREEPVAVEEEESSAAVGGGDSGGSFLRLGLLEVEKATGCFNDSARISGGVYRGTLHRMSVAVKVISPDIAVNEVRFARAADAMARARHPGLVKLIGACPEARIVVHELVPGGNLEDHLAVDAPPLPWHVRFDIAYQTCSVLSYLHSTDTVHGDVRPTNILLGDELCSSIKLAGLGMSRLAAPKLGGTVALAYVDPRYLATGELTPQCDVHALGVLLLRLVTGKPASAAKKAAREAATGGGRAWHEVVDASAGGWPMERATEVAILGLKCCHVSDGRAPPRPAAELLEEARGVLEAATSAAPGRT